MKLLKTYIVLGIALLVLFVCAACVSSGTATGTSSEKKTAKATEPLVLADFESGEPKGAFDSNWFAIADDDSSNHGNSKVAFSMTDGAAGSKHAVRVDYEHGPAYQYRFVLLKCEFPKVADFSSYESLAFTIKGSGEKLKIHIGTYDISDYDYHERVLGATPKDWMELVMPIADFKQEGWGKPKNLNPSHVLLLQFQTGSQVSGEKGWFAIDDVKLLPGAK
jgi:hypothetical protein